MSTPAARVRPKRIAELTSLSVRTVQELASQGQLPGAAKLAGVWTFDEQRVLDWIREQEARACPAKQTLKTFTAGVRPGGRASRSRAPSIEQAYALLISGKRKSTSPTGAPGSRP